MEPRWHGLFTILLTPFNEDGTLDEDSLRREVDFVIEAGCHGIVTPVNTSEFYLLTEQERRRLAEIVIKQADGRVPVVIGTAAPQVWTAEEMTRHARGAGASGVIATSPYVVTLDAEANAEYYDRIGRAAEGLPVVIQNGGEGLPLGVDAVIQLVKEVPYIQYVKEETEPTTHNISKLLAEQGDRLKGVFAGSFGRYLAEELKRGACGMMSGCPVVDAQVKVYELMQSGREQEAREANARQLAMGLMWAQLGLGFPKEIMRRRGIFRTAVCRKAVRRLDAGDIAEMEAVIRLMEGDLIGGDWRLSRKG